MNPDRQIPVQYEKLFDLLRQYSEKYYAETERIFRKFGYKWNPHASRFEIDVYFLSLLTFSIVGFKQDRNVGVELQLYFAERFIQRFGGKISTATTFEDIISSRVNSYCQLKNDCIKDSKNRNIEMEMLDALLQNLYWSISAGEIDAKPGVVIGDFFDKMELKSMMFPIQMGVSGEFRCCLKHLFKASSDIRSLSSEEIDGLIEDGRRDAKQILSKLDLSEITDSLSAGKLVRKALKDKIVSKADLLQMSDSKLIRTILKRQKKRKWWQFWK